MARPARLEMLVLLDQLDPPEVRALLDQQVRPEMRVLVVRPGLRAHKET